MTLTFAEAFFVGSATLVAVMVNEVGLLTLGAVSTPVLDIDPADVDQVTAVLLVPETVATNDWEAPDWTLAVCGETATLIPPPVGPDCTDKPKVLETDPSCGRSVTRTVKIKEPAAEGTPEITPVLGFKLNPAGSWPAEMLNW